MTKHEPVAVQLLDKTYQALLTSDFGKLGALSAALERELVQPSEPLTEASLRDIRRKAERNAACLLAAQRGIKAARRRIAEIRATAAGLVTYDRSGQKSSVTESRSLAQRF